MRGNLVIAALVLGQCAAASASSIVKLDSRPSGDGPSTVKLQAMEPFDRSAVPASAPENTVFSVSSSIVAHGRDALLVPDDHLVGAADPNVAPRHADRRAPVVFRGSEVGQASARPSSPRSSAEAETGTERGIPSPPAEEMPPQSPPAGAMPM